MDQQAANRPSFSAQADFHDRRFYGKDILWPNAAVGPEDIDITGSYRAFTFTTMVQLEDYGFCKKGEGEGNIAFLW